MYHRDLYTVAYVCHEIFRYKIVLFKKCLIANNYLAKHKNVIQLYSIMFLKKCLIRYSIINKYINNHQIH